MSTPPNTLPKATAPNQAVASPSNAKPVVATRPAVWTAPGSRGNSIIGTRPTFLGPHAEPPVARMLQYQPTHTMGLGLFAKEDIPKGTRILMEQPLFSLPTNNPATASAFANADNGGWFVPNVSNTQDYRYDADVEFFCRHVIKVGLNSAVITEMEKLFAPADLPASADKFRYVLVELFVLILDHETLIKLWGNVHVGYPPYGTEYLTGHNPEDYRFEAMSNLAVRYARLYAIWRNNRVVLAPGSATVEAAVFRIASRINHSCCPNVARAWTHIGGNEPHKKTGLPNPPSFFAQTVNATHDIRAGEQIFVAYGDYALRTRASRAQELRAGWGIERCGCRLCVEPVLEALQRRAWGLLHGAVCWLRSGPWNEVVMRQNGFELPKNGLQALAAAEECIDVLTHPVWDCRSAALARAYSLASTICESVATNPEKLGLPNHKAVPYWTKAMLYSGRRIQVLIMVEGTDGTFLKKAEEHNKLLNQRRQKWMLEKTQKAEQNLTASSSGHDQ